MKTENLDFESLYNEEVKMRFLEETSDTASSLSIAFYHLRGAARTEEQLGKDLYDMNITEMEAVLYDIQSSTVFGVVNHINLYNKYIKWAIEKGLVKDYSNFTVFEGKHLFSWGKKFVANYKAPNYRREEILDIVNDFKNESDKAIVLAAFEGISGHGYSELLNLERKDLHKKDGKFYAELTETKDENINNRTIEISEGLYSALMRADAETEYVTQTGKSPYIPSDKILKKTNRGAGSNPNLDDKFILRKFTKVYKDHFENSYVTFKDIRRSGMAQMAEDLGAENRGKVTSEMLKDIAHHYGTPWITANGYTYRNTAVIRRALSAKDIHKKFNFKL